ncbi:hypothetical protein HHX47_DHR7000628 [Lentinula edodes]|nr:hypothetical protein HHX47_DHR7000628 [Lentinula edodes]
MQRKFLPITLLVRAHGSSISRNWPPVKGLRFTSSTTSSNSTSSFTTRTTTFFVLGSALVGGLLGFTLADRARTSLPSHSLIPTGSATKPTYGSPEDFGKAIEELKRTFPGEDIVSTDPEDVYNHGFSVNDYHPGISHSVVVYPSTTEDVVKIVKIATKYRMPITAYSGATSLEGQFRGVKIHFAVDT